MKKFVFIIALVLMMGSAQAGWFDNREQEQQIAKLNSEIQAERKSKADWQEIAFVLGVGCVITLVTGAAIGSKARRSANE